MSTIKELKDEVNKIRNMKQIEYSRLNRELEELESETIQMMVERDVLNEKIHENNEQIETIVKRTFNILLNNSKASNL